MSETNLVWHATLDISLNLARPDLGHPDRPNLWEQLREKTIHRGELRCMGRCYEIAPTVPQWVYLREQGGRRQAVHLNPAARANHASEPESPEHKALKERGYGAARRAGLDAVLEDRAAHGKRITDLVITADGHRLGVEYQRYLEGPSRIKRRVDIAQADGLTPFWATDNPDLPIDYRAPFARFNGVRHYEIRAGASLRVVSGYDKAAYERCGWEGPKCPVTGGRPCGRLHVYRMAASIELDDLLVGAATRAYLPLKEPKRGGGFNYRWMLAVDLERYRDDRSEATRTVGPAREQSPESGADLACNRRAGSLIPGQRRQPATLASLNWAKNAAGDPRPCWICRKPALMRDDTGRPCHKVCAESRLTNQEQENA